MYNSLGWKSEMMTGQALDEVVARQFLLGQLSPEEQGRIEEQAFEDRNTFEFIESVENDLIDEFIQGDLSADDEERFETHFLSLPGRRDNLKISRMLRQEFDKTPGAAQKERFSFPGWFKQQSTWLQISMTAAALALVIFAVWIFIRAWESTRPVLHQAGPDKSVVVPSPQIKVSPLIEPTPPVHVENKPKGVTPERQKRITTYALLLPSAAPRGEGVQQLKLAPDAPSMTIELALITERNFRSYEAALENEAGKSLQGWPNLKAERLRSGKALKIDVPVTLLKPQEFYRIVVSGVSATGETEVIARYPFEVKE